MRGTLFAALVLMGCNEPSIGGDGDREYDIRELERTRDQVTDSFEQPPPTSADVLFVISNWWSDGQLRQELIDSFDDLLNVFLGSGIDYHIGVISTDTDHFHENGKLHEADGVRWIDPETPNPLETFATMASMDAQGCVGPRRPRDATWLALEVEEDSWNAGFRRDDASLHTVFVSDAGDESYRLSVDEFIRWYDGYTATPEVDTLSTIIDPLRDNENPYVTTMVGGATHHIDDRPWRNVLLEIGLRAQVLNQEFMLSAVPVLDTIVVEISHHEQTQRLSLGDDFTYSESRNSVQLVDYQPPTGASIDISYDRR
ncbi:MAG: hypothetical protein AAGA48_33435 [Myxococcota bacterium]